uniref:Glycosyltransferase RgtA/B/C/D-like domain-containing protein n=1 Tax=Desulfobacca acetoxidans TaxID=60893 RepID=A0A7V6DPN7_9BACT
MKERIGAGTRFLSQPRRAWPWVIFALGLGVFLSFQVSLVSSPYRYRSLPVEADDAYSYIVKTPELMQYLFQDSPALKDLRPQVTPSPHDPYPLAIEKWTRHVRFYTQYHPLYSLGLWALVKGEGISYEDAYRQMSILGSLGLAAIISFLLVTLAGPSAAGLALASIAPLVFPGQDIIPAGIYSVVPSTLSLGIGLLMFAYLARREGRPGLTFYGLNLLAMGLHPMGLPFTGLAVLFGIACRYPQEKFRCLQGFAPSLVLMALFWVLIHRVPPFTMVPLPTPHGFDYVREVLGNFEKLVFFYPKVFLLENGWPRGLFFLSKTPWWLVALTQTLGVCLGIISLRLRASSWRKAVFLAAVLLLAPVVFTLGAAALLLLILWRGLSDPESGRPRLLLSALSVLFAGMVISCFYVLPDGPSNVLDRTYVFWALSAAAVLGRGLMLMATAPGLGQVLPRFAPVSLENWTASRPWFWRVLLSAFVIFCLLPQKVRDYNLMSIVRQSSIDRYDMVMEVTQPRWVLRETSPADVILYDRDDTECILPFFLTHGCLSRRAVYLPYLPLPPGLAFDPARVKFLVGTNPYLRLCQTLTPQGQPTSEPYVQLITLKNYLALPPGATLTLELASATRPEALEVLNLPGNLASPGQHLLLTRHANGETWNKDLSLPPGVWTTWSFPVNSGGSLTVSNPDKKQTVALGGLRLQPGSNPHWQWPWDGVDKVTWDNPSASQCQSFSPPRDISFQGRTYRLIPLMDKGASVVWKLALMP